MPELLTYYDNTDYVCTYLGMNYRETGRSRTVISAEVIDRRARVSEQYAMIQHQHSQNVSNKLCVRLIVCRSDFLPYISTYVCHVHTYILS